ncbi:MAG: IS66 family transposase [Nanoarchaeota archaeon]
MNKKELRQLSKRELIDIILQQQDVISQLAKRIEELERYIKVFDNPHTPSSKKRSKENTVHDEQTRFPGKPKGSNGAGIDMPTPDKEEKVTKDNCPECGKMLGKPYDIYKFRQMDIPEPKFVTTLYVVGLYKCNFCKAEIDAGEDLHKGFYGANTTTLIGYLKKEGLSCEAIAELFNDVYNMPISNVAVFDKLTGLTNSLAPEKEQIANAINSSEYAHLDETGLRQDGKNGFVWNASTPEHCLFEFDRSRASDVAKRILSDFNGTIITDDYKGYAWHPLRQLCWSHLLRESKEFAEKYPDSFAQYERLKQLYDKAKHSQETGSDVYNKLVWELEDIARCYQPLDGCKIMYCKLHERSHMWLLGVKCPTIPLTNNHAERCLRKVVMQRNRIGCIRNFKGEAFINIFLSCTSTWKLQGKNVYRELLKFAS